MTQVVRVPTASPQVTRVPDSEARVTQSGLTGPPGPKGESGAGINYTQATPAPQWVINHNTGSRPAVTVYSAGGMEVMAEVTHTTPNQVVVTFITPMAGSARLL